MANLRSLGQENDKLGEFQQKLAMICQKPKISKNKPNYA